MTYAVLSIAQPEIFLAIAALALLLLGALGAPKTSGLVFNLTAASVDKLVAAYQAVSG